MSKTSKKASLFSSDDSAFSSPPDSEEEDLLENSEAEDEDAEVSIVEPAPPEKRPAQPEKRPAQPAKQLSLLQPSTSKKPVNVYLRSFFHIETLPDGRMHITCKHPGCAFDKKVNRFNATIAHSHLVNSCGGIDITTRFRLLESEYANQ